MYNRPFAFNCFRSEVCRISPDRPLQKSFWFPFGTGWKQKVYSYSQRVFGWFKFSLQVSIVSKDAKSMNVTKHLTNMHMSTVQKNEIFSSNRQGRLLEAPGVARWKYRTVDMCMFVKCLVTIWILKELLHMWVWHHEMLTSPPEVLENGVPLMVQSPHLQQLLFLNFNN